MNAEVNPLHPEGGGGGEREREKGRMRREGRREEGRKGVLDTTGIYHMCKL